jgi:hypothetical protein
VLSDTSDETIHLCDETIFRFWCRRPETPHGYQVRNHNGGQRRRRQPETVKMRTLSFILAFAFLLAGPTMAGLSDSSLPGVGTFTYSGPPIVASAPAIIVAAR